MIGLNLCARDFDEMQRRFVDLAWFLCSEGVLTRSKVAEVSGFSQQELMALFRIWEKPKFKTSEPEENKP